jgi:polyvinyl alcohol dehydrogenase (cytochrome)
MPSISRAALAFALVLTASVPAVLAQTPSGEATYQTHCAACHDSTSPRVPTRAALQQMPAARIARALEGGAMMTIALTMSREERLAVSTFLGKPGAVDGPPSSAFCADRTRGISRPPPQALQPIAFQA